MDGILGHPVGVEDTQGPDLATDTLLGDGAKVTAGLDGVHTGGGRLTVADALGHLALATTTLDAHAEDGKALLSLVSEAASLVRTSGLGGAVDGRKLTELPGPNTGQEAHDIGLLLLPELFHVLVSAHFVCCFLVTR